MMDVRNLFLGLIFLSAGTTANAQDITPSLMTYFEQRWNDMDQSMGLWYTYSDNKGDALLGNSQDVILGSYLAMFRGTANTNYLNRFIQQMDIVISKRDDIAGTPDYSGVANPVWSTRKEGYVSDPTKAYGFLVESGNLIYPMADFAQIIIRGPDWLKFSIYTTGERYIDIALRYRQRALETYLYHMQRFHTAVIGGKSIGWFSSRPDANFLVGIAPGKPYPLNFTTSFGRAAVMLWLAFNKTGSFMDTARRIGNYARLEMELKSNGAYVWRYYPKMSYYPAGYVNNFGNTNNDDIYHGAITVEFAHLLFKHGLGVFGETDIHRLANTFLNNIVIDPVNPYRFNFMVDGLGPGANYQYLNEAGMFFYLARPENTVAAVTYDSLVRWLQVHISLKGASGHRSFAHLIRHYLEAVNGVRFQ